MKKLVIGVIHFAPLLGYNGYTSKEYILNNALKDLDSFEKGGVDGVIIENNYDLPHKIFVGPETVAMMTYLGEKIREKTNLILGVSVLFNDYRAALAIAKVIGADFVRVPVFVDDVKTDFGVIRGNPLEVIKYREAIKAEEIKIYTDIQVKHAELLDKKSLKVSAIQAIKSNSDGLIVTGKWTGIPPSINEIKEVKSVARNVPVFVGSGVDYNNVDALLKYADGVIVSTSLKTGTKNFSHRNVKPFTERIDANKVKRLIEKVRGLK